MSNCDVDIDNRTRLSPGNVVSPKLDKLTALELDDIGFRLLFPLFIC